VSDRPRWDRAKLLVQAAQDRLNAIVPTKETPRETDARVKRDQERSISTLDPTDLDVDDDLDDEVTEILDDAAPATETEDE
ncbi:MAG TPA: hypothetical protein VEM14_03320, partial [Gemmatimonadaceae bacterium]|nr:hypothetical protein [Gemmatimonadaceae bacterium]